MMPTIQSTPMFPTGTEHTVYVNGTPIGTRRTLAAARRLRQTHITREMADAELTRLHPLERAIEERMRVVGTL